MKLKLVVLKFSLLYLFYGALVGSYYAIWQNEFISIGFGVETLAGIMAIQTLISTIIEIPSGVIADRIGHKRTVIIGLVLHMIAFIPPSISGTYTALCFAILTLGGAGAFLNGALQSWTAEVQEDAMGGLKTSSFIKWDQIQRIGMILGSLSIPFIIGIVDTHHQLPWMIFFVLAFILTIISLNVPHEKTRKQHHSLIETWKFSSLVVIFRSRTLLWIFLGIFIFGIADGIVSATFWPKIRQLGINQVAYFGFIQTSLSLSRLIGLQIWKKISWIEQPFVPGISLAISSLFFFLFAVSSQPLIAITWWLIRIVIVSIYFTAIDVMLLRFESTKLLRATVLSVAAVVTSLGIIFSTTVISLLSKNSSLINTFCIFGAIFTFISGLVFLASNNKKKSDN